MSEILSTKNYAMFKTMVGNRPIVKSHLEKLKRAIQRDNQLHLHPIIVNDLNEVIDGQHRTRAAADLGEKIYYIKSNTVKDFHLIDSNVNQRSWELHNFINYYSENLKLKDYVLLKELSAKLGVFPRAVLTMICGHVTNPMIQKVKDGKFTIPPTHDYVDVMGFYLDVLEFCDKQHIRPRGMFLNVNFIKAIRTIFFHPNFKTKIFFTKLENRWFELKPQVGAKEWYKVLALIYNYRNTVCPIDPDYFVSVKED